MSTLFFSHEHWTLVSFMRCECEPGKDTLVQKVVPLVSSVGCCPIKTNILLCREMEQITALLTFPTWNESHSNRSKNNQRIWIIPAHLMAWIVYSTSWHDKPCHPSTTLIVH